jgi:pilus assembly protein CpaE
MNFSPDTLPAPQDHAEPRAARIWAAPAAPLPAPPPAAPPAREKFIGFAQDEASATLLHTAFAACLPNNSNIHVAGFRAALDILHAVATPEIVLIDLSCEDQPMNAVMELAEAVEPGTIVLAIGDTKNVSFYRTVTKGMGIKEYLPKPLSAALVEQHFLPIVANMNHAAAAPRGGRMVAVTGTRGGVGTTTLASNLAWYIGSALRRHTVLLDGELHTGTVALNFNLRFNNGLTVALQSPERVDQLLLERSAQSAGDRLHVLAGQEKLDTSLNYQPGGAGPLIEALRTRYNFVVADTGCRTTPFAQDLRFVAQQRIIVLDPSIIGIRNLEKLLALPGGPSQSPHCLVVLNRAGAPGGLSQSYMERSIGLRFDAVIPDLPRLVPKATQFGTQAAASRGPFRSGIAALAASLGVTALAEAG